MRLPAVKTLSRAIPALAALQDLRAAADNVPAVPAPLPLLGVAATAACTRRLRARVRATRT